MTDGMKPGSWQAEAWEHFKALGKVVTEELNRGMPEGLKLVWSDEESQKVPEGQSEAGEGAAGRSAAGEGTPEGRWITQQELADFAKEQLDEGARQARHGGEPGRWISFAELGKQRIEAKQEGIDQATAGGQWISDGELRDQLHLAECKGAAMARRAASLRRAEAVAGDEKLRAADRLIGAQAFLRWFAENAGWSESFDRTLERQLDDWRRTGGHQEAHLRPVAGSDGPADPAPAKDPGSASAEAGEALSGSLNHTLSDHGRVEPLTHEALLDHMAGQHREVRFNPTWHPGTVDAMHLRDHRRKDLQVSAVSTGPEDQPLDRMGELVMEYELDVHREYGQMLVQVAELVAELVAQIEAGGPGAHGDPLLAVCLDCQPVLPMPFGGETRVEAENERMEWITEHRAGTGHRVVRPEFLADDLQRISAKGRWS